MNRVREILSCSEFKQWNYVPGEANIADLPSRGCNPSDLLRSEWWNGPEWLKDERLWPIQGCDMNKEVKEALEAERKKSVSNLLSLVEPCLIFRYFSKASRILRLVAWMRRFVENAKDKGNKRRGPLTYQEINEAEGVVLKVVQAEGFSGCEDKEFKGFEVFKDSQGLLRLKTKIVYGEYGELFRFPILLPFKHIFVHRLIEESHLNMSHAGVGTLVTFLREKYWIIKARKAVRKVVSSCVRCQKFNSKHVETPSIALPKDRVTLSNAFAVTGIDAAGPLYLRGGRKVWIIIFTCAVYRSVHFVVVSSISTECFLLAFRRFMARRGRIMKVFCDNGSNFVGAYNLWKGLDYSKINYFADSRCIEWNFNPPAAPWWGGFWERMVRTLKDLLKRNLGRVCVTYEELVTVVVDCEAVINARPLTYFNEDPKELITLTPSMFIQPIVEYNVADIDAVDESLLRRRSRYLLSLRKNLRTRFRKEYLAQLVKFGSNRAKGIAVGDIVLIGSKVVTRLKESCGL